MDNEKFGKFIKELRIKNKLTQKQLGEKIHITDKAISKWERGQSFPDVSILNSLSETFNVSISELINGEYGKKEIDIEKEIQEAMQNIQNIRKKKKTKNKKIIKIISFIVFIIFFILQAIYLLLMKNRGYEYIYNSIFYIINEILILSITVYLICSYKNVAIKIISFTLCCIITAVNVIFFINNESNTKNYISFSKNFSNRVVLKLDKTTGKISYYRDFKFFIFTKYKEDLEYEAKNNIKLQWLTNDICGVTYEDKNNKIREFVATFGDRGDGISYYYVTNSILGEWKNLSQYGENIKIIVNSKGITIKEKQEEFFEYSDCKQFGTIALVLFKGDIPKYIIALNEDCYIKDTYIEDGGTISLTKVSMEKNKPVKLSCITNKSGNMDNYNVVDLGINDFIIKNGILYVSIDGKNVKEVPGDFSNLKTQDFNEFNSQISEDKIVFYYENNEKRFLVYSNDLGSTWETVEIKNEGYIEEIQFVNSNVGYIFEIDDVAMSLAFGKILRTQDGGKTWKEVYTGFGDEDVKSFNRGSKFKFINENLGFLRMPSISGESAELYITRNGGNSFEKIELSKNDIYDCYELPELDNEKLTIRITQGSDGDYNGGDYKVFSSNDLGNTWKEE